MSYSHEWGAQRIFLAPPPGALGRGQKVKYHLNSITKSISKFQTLFVLSQMQFKTYHTGYEWGLQHNFLAPPPGQGSKGQISFNFNYKVNFKIFIPNSVCVLTNERYKTYQTFFFILLPGSSPMGGTWGVLRDQNQIRPAVCPLCYLLLNQWTKFNQIWCVSYSHEWGAQHIFFAPPPGEGSKGQYHLISMTKSISKIFIPNFVCVLTNEKYKTYQTGFSLCSLGHAPGVGLWGAGAAQVVKKSNFQT